MRTLLDLFSPTQQKADGECFQEIKDTFLLIWSLPENQHTFEGCQVLVTTK